MNLNANLSIVPRPFSSGIAGKFYPPQKDLLQQWLDDTKTQLGNFDGSAYVYVTKAQDFSGTEWTKIQGFKKFMPKEDAGAQDLIFQIDTADSGRLYTLKEDDDTYSLRWFGNGSGFVTIAEKALVKGCLNYFDLYGNDDSLKVVANGVDYGTIAITHTETAYPTYKTAPFDIAKFFLFSFSDSDEEFSVENDFVGSLGTIPSSIKDSNDVLLNTNYLFDRKHNKCSLNILAVGDSRTAGTGSSTADSWIDRYTDQIRLNNLSVAGSTSSQYLAVLLAQDLSNIDIVFYSPWSPNDGTPTETISDEQISKAIQANDYCEANNAKCVFVWLTPRDTLDATQDSFRIRTKTELENLGFSFLDMITAVAQGTTPDRFKVGYTSDGLHTNDTGYQAQSDLFYEPFIKEQKLAFGVRSNAYGLEDQVTGLIYPNEHGLVTATGFPSAGTGVTRTELSQAPINNGTTTFLSSTENPDLKDRIYSDGTTLTADEISLNKAKVG